MLRFSLYDFDRTIYQKDTGIEVIKSIYFHEIRARFFLPKILFYGLLCFFKIIPRDRLKEIFFSPFSLFTKTEWESFIQSFWIREQKNLFPDVVTQITKDHEEGLIIGVVSASAEIMLYPIVHFLPVDFCIGTQLATTESHLTSIIVGKNCKNQQKVLRVQEYIQNHYPDQEYSIAKMYSDSLHDLPLLEWAQNPFTVESDGTIREGFPKPNRNI